MTPVLIGIAGASGSGKSELACRLQARFVDARILQLDSYYSDLSEWPIERRAIFNFDHPDALDHKTLVRQVTRLSCGEAIECPVYDFATHTRSNVVTHIEPASFILVEGLFALHFEDLRNLYQLKVYVETADQTCLERRLARDTRERGRTVECVSRQYEATVRPMAEAFVWPQREFADVVVSGTQHIEESVEAVATSLAPIPNR